MFKVVEKTYNTPIRMIARPGVKFIPGRVAKLCELETGTVACDISNGNSIFGVIGNYKYIPELSFEEDDMVELWTPRMVFRTDQFDKKYKYITGNTLFVNRKGLFTIQAPHKDAYYVGRVITGPNDDKRFFEAIWL